MSSIQFYCNRMYNNIILSYANYYVKSPLHYYPCSYTFPSHFYCSTQSNLLYDHNPCRSLYIHTVLYEQHKKHENTLSSRFVRLNSMLSTNISTYATEQYEQHQTVHKSNIQNENQVKYYLLVRILFLHSFGVSVFAFSCYACRNDWDFLAINSYFQRTIDLFSFRVCLILIDMILSTICVYVCIIH